MADNLAKKLTRVMAAIDHVEKRGTNTFQNYDYVKAVDIARAVRNGLSEQGVFMTAQILEKRNYIISGKNGEQQAIDLHVRYHFHDSDSDAVLFTDGFGSGVDKGDKAGYKALTGCLKYALRTAFLIPDESDPENEAVEPQPTRKAPKVSQTPATGVAAPRPGPRPVSVQPPPPPPPQEPVEGGPITDNDLPENMQKADSQPPAPPPQDDAALADVPTKTDKQSYASRIRRMEYPNSDAMRNAVMRLAKSTDTIHMTRTQWSTALGLLEAAHKEGPEQLNALIKGE